MLYSEYGLFLFVLKHNLYKLTGTCCHERCCVKLEQRDIHKSECCNMLPRAVFCYILRDPCQVFSSD